jgi:hypothetical protein
MTTLETTTRNAIFVPRASRLVTALEVLIVAACLALGVGFVGTLWSAPSAGPAVTATAPHATPAKG